MHTNVYISLKKRDPYKIFRQSLKFLWEPCSQVPCHYPTLEVPPALTLQQFIKAFRKTKYPVSFNLKQYHYVLLQEKEFRTKQGLLIILCCPDPIGSAGNN